MRKRVTAVLAAVAVSVGLMTAPSPASAETYSLTCQLEFTFGSIFESPMEIIITADGPAGPVAPGVPFTLSNLVVESSGGGIPNQNVLAELTVLGGQTINLGPGFTNEDFRQQWGPMNVELDAPSDDGTYDLAPEAMVFDVTTSPTLIGVFCPADGGEFPDEAFAEVTVDGDVPPPPPPPPPPNGNGNGNGNGPGPENGNGPGPENGNGTGTDPQNGDRDTDPETLDEVTRVGPDVVSATPTFTG